MLTITHLTKKYGEKTAVNDLSLTIEAGEIYGFIGHNGAGKTTTLKACCGLIDFDEGEITIDGNSVKGDPLACKRVTAYIPDNPDMYDFLTGLEYLNFVADVYGVSAEDRRARMAHYGELLSITEAYSQPISSMSHGMRQKIAIISALIHRPKLIIMDEPFVGLDPSAAHRLKELMRTHCKAGGAIFFSTHVLEVAEKLCHKVAVIKDGVLLKNGAMESVIGDASLEDVFLELADADKTDGR